MIDNNRNIGRRVSCFSNTATLPRLLKSFSISCQKRFDFVQLSNLFSSLFSSFRSSNFRLPPRCSHRYQCYCNPLLRYPTSTAFLHFAPGSLEKLIRGVSATAILSFAIRLRLRFSSLHPAHSRGSFEGLTREAHSRRSLERIIREARSTGSLDWLTR